MTLWFIWIGHPNGNYSLGCCGVGYDSFEEANRVANEQKWFDKWKANGGVVYIFPERYVVL